MMGSYWVTFPLFDPLPLLLVGKTSDLFLGFRLGLFFLLLLWRDLRLAQVLELTSENLELEYISTLSTSEWAMVLFFSGLDCLLGRLAEARGGG